MSVGGARLAQVAGAGLFADAAGPFDPAVVRGGLSWHGWDQSIG